MRRIFCIVLFILMLSSVCWSSDESIVNDKATAKYVPLINECYAAFESKNYTRAERLAYMALEVSTQYENRADKLQIGIATLRVLISIHANNALKNADNRAMFQFYIDKAAIESMAHDSMVKELNELKR